MAHTVQQLVDQARLPLNDPDKIRYPDSELLTYANLAFLRARKKRPDLFVGMWGVLPVTLTLTDYFPVPDEYVPVVADYISSRAELKDDEHVGDGRFVALNKMFDEGMLAP